MPPARTLIDTIPPEKVGQVETLAFATAIDVAPATVRLGLLMECFPLQVMPSCMVQLPSPPVVQGRTGKTPPSNVSLPDPDMHDSRLDSCDGVAVELEKIVGLSLEGNAGGGLVFGRTVFVALGSVVPKSKAIVGLLLRGIAEGGDVIGPFVFVAVGSVVAKADAIVGLLPSSISEGGYVIGPFVFVAVGLVVAEGKAIVGL
jgi:hypothetical protein